MRLLGKADPVGQREERIERLVAEIDDLAHAVLGDQAVEQRHLALDIADAGDGRARGQELRQRAAARIEIESRHRPAFPGVELGEQPRQQRLADARARRSDDGDGMAERHQTPPARTR